MLKASDFSNDAEVKWCPGCGDHAILKHFQSALAKSGSNPKSTVVVSGIGCASRLPYYMSTYGFHTIHGRALPIATGIKLSKPETELWVVTGDGDGLSIGGNHFIHFFRKNFDINVLLFNNEIYGLTKGQFSPTSSVGLKTKSSPQGTVDRPINALHLALTAGATFVSRTYDRDASNIQDIFIAAKQHTGGSLVEILQNCPIFNDNVFDKFTNKSTNAQHSIRLEDGYPLRFGFENEFVIIIDNLTPKAVPFSKADEDKIWIHDSQDLEKALILSRFGHNELNYLPLVFGVLYDSNIVSTKSAPKNDYEQILQKTFTEGNIEF